MSAVLSALWDIVWTAGYLLLRYALWCLCCCIVVALFFGTIFLLVILAHMPPIVWLVLGAAVMLFLALI